MNSEHFTLRYVMNAAGDVNHGGKWVDGKSEKPAPAISGWTIQKFFDHMNAGINFWHYYNDRTFRVLEIVIHRLLSLSKTQSWKVNPFTVLIHRCEQSNSLRDVYYIISYGVGVSMS